jgi:type VI secretion system protein ImpL
VASLPEWIPANFAGPNGSKVFTRRSGRTLRVGLPGAFTYSGFHDVVLELIEEVAAEAALDRTVFAGGCDESAETSIPALTADVLKLYYDDFIAQWDSFLRDIRLAPLTDLNVASDNLKDLSSADSALKRLVTAVVRETELTRVEDEADESASSGRPPRAASRVLGRLGKAGRLARQGMRLLPSTTGATAETDLSGAPVAEHFKPIKGAVAEIDGLPPQLDATVVALTALSNMIQTVSASPDPQEAIKRQGGLAELTGAVAAQARSLPGPLDDWLAGIAGDTTGLTERAVTGQLNAIWRAEVLPFCQAALANRYPFDPGSAVDVNIRDFARLFGPGGMIDAFINDHLIGYVDTTSTPWRWRADFGLSPSVLAAFQQARQIRDELFAGGSGPVMNFTLEPKDLSTGAARVTLNLDGQILTFFHNATRPEPMSWPGSDGTGVVTLAFQPVAGSPEVLVTETGSWAWLRMLRSGQFTGTTLPEVYRLRLAGRGHYADFELRASSVENPYSLEMFARFTCPENI